MVDLVLRYRVVTDQIVRIAHFTPGNDSGCQRTLTLLVRHKWLDRLERQSPTDPAVYLLSRRSSIGNRLMQRKYGERVYRQHLTRLGSVGHALGVSWLRVLIERGCRDLQWRLHRWQRPEELEPILAQAKLVPDGYAQIKRPVDGQERTAGLFIEFERSYKANSALARKLEFYSRVYYSGRYAELFGTRALRLLFAFSSEPTISGQRRVESALALAEKMGITLARFASLEALQQVQPTEVLTSPLWYQPGQSDPQPLFDLGAHA